MNSTPFDVQSGEEDIVAGCGEDLTEQEMTAVESNVTNTSSVESQEPMVCSIGSENFTENQHRMLERLSKDPQIMVKSQQRDEPDLSSEQKLDMLKTVFVSDPEQFLVRFGAQLRACDSNCFDKWRQEKSYGVAFHLNEVEKSWTRGANEKRLKNRRYEALKRLVETTDYFSEEEMQRRNPILFDQLIGRYHTEEERAAFLQQSWKSTSGSGTTSTPLTDLFLAHLDRTDDGISCRRLAQESQQDEEDEADAEIDSEVDEDEDMESESMEPGCSNKAGRSPTRKPVDDTQPREEIEDDEKELLKEEFFTTMYRNFLNGKEEDFDYSAVDDNPEYDCGENLENDEEEKYFDDEEPCEVSEPNSDLDDLFRPPVRSADIENKIENLTVSNESSVNPVCEQNSKSVTTMVEDDDEDELDLYMKEIEKQLQS